MKLVSLLLSLTLTGFQLSAQTGSVPADTIKSVSQSDTLLMPVLSKNITSVDSLPIVVQTPNGARIDVMVKYAKTFLGTPYHYSGTTPSGFDC